MLGGVGLLCFSAAALAQSAAVPEPVGRVASLAPGSIRGTVQDDAGAPIAGAMISAMGATTAFAMSDRTGHFELRTLSPGPYLVRAHLSGFAASRGQIVDVHPSSRASSLLALHRLAGGTAPYPVLAAGLGGGWSDPAAATGGADDDGDAIAPADDHGETAWRLRHARRGILKDATAPRALLADDDPSSNQGAIAGRNNFLAAPARLATNFFAATPFSGQFNLLTTGSFDSPQQLFTADGMARSVAYMSVSAPVRGHADWTVRGALTQGDVSSWIIAGSYVTRAPARHQYEVGLSYSTQRYNAGNPAAFYDVSDGTRNSGAVYGFDTFTITPEIGVTYGARYARYDYLEGRSLLSPRVQLTVSPAKHMRLSAALSQRAVAPGAEELVPPSDLSGVWLPPQRTFSSLADRPLQAERTTHAQFELERDVARSTIVLRGFTQRVADQLVTVFGLDLPDRPASLGHYFVGNNGSVRASGWTAGVRTAFAERLHGSIEYTDTYAHWNQISDPSVLMVVAPTAAGSSATHIHDVATSLEATVPETSTSVLVLYRVSNAFARESSAPDAGLLDSRFDVQVRQALPFMDFSSAKWEMLLAVRNFFRETAIDQSVYDELLVVRPPKRIVGGLTLHF
jgi:hypothetical protein